MDEIIQVVTTVNEKAYAEQLAGELIERGLAACAQVGGPVESVYRWHGKIERQNEWKCIVKTTRGRFDDVASAICELHPYDVPEILATPVVAGSEEYLNWVRDAVRGGAE